MSTLFIWNSWLFLTNTVVIFILAVYFKRICDLLLGFILGVAMVHLHIYLNSPISDVNPWHKTPVSISVNTVFNTSDGQYTLSSICIRDDNCIKGYLSFSSVREQPKASDVYQGVVSIRPYRTTMHFLGQNKELSAYLNRIYFKGKVISIEKKLQTTKDWRFSFRDYWFTQTKGLSYQSLYYTLLTGDKSSFDSAQREQFKILGLSHLLAISGMHVGIIYGLGFWFSRLGLLFVVMRNRQQPDINRWSAMIGLLLSGLYVYICFAPVSAQRAFIMLSGLVICYLAGRRWASFSSILFSLFLVIALNPLAWFDLGLYFSFFAFSAVIIGLNVVRRFNIHVVFKLLVVQLSCFLLLLPLTSYFFGGVSVSGILVNLIAIPFLSLILFPSLLFDLLLSVYTGQLYLLPFLDSLIGWAFQLTSLIPSHYHWAELPAFGRGTLVAVYVALALSAVPFLRVFSFVLLMLCSAQVLYSQKTPPSLTVFDVGHGTMVLLEYKGKGLVYDLGPSYFGSFNYVERLLLPHAHNAGLKQMMVILSHNDSDHTGGLPAFMNSGYAQSSRWQDYFDCKKPNFNGESEIKIEVLWPLKPNLLTGDNNNSCVLKITINGFSVLLPGDIEQAAERHLAQSQNLASTILLVPHHGSKSSSSEQFVEQVSPKYAVISRAFYSPWRIPDENVLKRYQDIGAKIYDTALDGDIRFEFHKEKIVVKTAREFRHWWFLGN